MSERIIISHYNKQAIDKKNTIIITAELLSPLYAY
jgi:hypothetical protein